MWALISRALRALSAALTLVLVGLDRPGVRTLSATPARRWIRQTAMAHIRLIIVLAALLAVPAVATAQRTPALPPMPDLRPPRGRPRRHLHRRLRRPRPQAPRRSRRHPPPRP